VKPRKNAKSSFSVSQLAGDISVRGPILWFRHCR